MHPNLSFEQAPPLSVPYRFFLTAPWFGVAAGLLLVLHGEAVFASRWTMEALAAAHLLTVGLMLQVMVGALLQFVPVAAGGNVWRPRLIAGIAHPVLVLATLALVAAFLTGRPLLFIAATTGFVAALVLVCGAVGQAVFRAPAHGATILALRLAIVGLAVTTFLGVVLAFGMAYGGGVPMLELTDVHAAWGLGGWALMLLAGVTYFVVPMFQLTPRYPGWAARSLPPALFAVLLLWTLLLLGLDGRGRTAALLGGLALGCGFGLLTLHLQARRLRKTPDTTLRFFRVAMLSLVALWVSALAWSVVPGWAHDPRAALWLGVLAIVGVFVSALNGMLYKIVPFLNWLHLQRQCPPGALPPTMNRMISAAAQRGQSHAHLAALIMLLGAVWLPGIAWLAGGAFAASCAWLGWNLIGAARVYLSFADRMRAGAAGRG